MLSLLTSSPSGCVTVSWTSKTESAKKMRKKEVQIVNIFAQKIIQEKSHCQIDQSQQ